MSVATKKAPLRRPPPPPPPPLPAFRAQSVGLPMPGAIADAHKRRVTLNILRLAACCPEPLREVLERLHRYGYDLMALPRQDRETIYGYVDDDLANKAKDEFAADLQTIIDHRGDEAECKLCGQQHIRFEFLLRNKKGGKDHWTGSVCIVTYGLNIDGYGTGEAALAALRGAIAAAIRKCEMEDWQAKYPAHAIVMGRLEGFANGVWREGARSYYGAHRDYLRTKYLPDGRRESDLPFGWVKECKKAASKAKAILKFYRANGFLTNVRTPQVFGPDGLLLLGESHERKIATLVERDKAVENYWRSVLPLIPAGSYDRTYIEQAIRGLYDPRVEGTAKRVAQRYIDEAKRASGTLPEKAEPKPEPAKAETDDDLPI